MRPPVLLTNDHVAVLKATASQLERALEAVFVTILHLESDTARHGEEQENESDSSTRDGQYRNHVVSGHRIRNSRGSIDEGSRPHQLAAAARTSS